MSRVNPCAIRIAASSAWRRGGGGLHLRPVGIGGETPSLPCYPIADQLIAGGWMRRREFITLLGGATAWPLTARAQHGERMRSIGGLTGVPRPDDQDAQANIAAFLEGLKQLGWVDGRNVRIDYRWGLVQADTIRRQA